MIVIKTSFVDLHDDREPMTQIVLPQLSLI